jgi:hypothetical protein
MSAIACWAEFSRHHCIAICATILPIELLATSGAMLLTAMVADKKKVAPFAGVTIVCAVSLIAHVVSWWTIGVVMPPTFILPVLSVLCLAIVYSNWTAAGRWQAFWRRLPIWERLGLPQLE